MGVSRRRFLRLLAGSELIHVAGCLDGSETDRASADIIAGPEGRLVFDPERLELSVGETVQWFFASSGHNVSGRPQHSDLVELPTGAEPFASYNETASSRAIVQKGQSFTHTFDVPGSYTYVCIPHAAAGMTGQLIVAD